VCAHDQHNGEGEKAQLIIRPYLFGYQAAHTTRKKQPRTQPMMMAMETVPECGGPDDEGEGDHAVFKKGVMEDIDTQDGQRGHRQRHNGAVDGTEDRSGDAQGIQIELSKHGQQNYYFCNTVANKFLTGKP
jgi:hypothetical protein